MLTMLLSPNWRVGHEEILRRIAQDVKNEQEGRIFLVPELISHETERSLCYAAGDTASRFAEVMSFTGLQRRVSESVGSAAQECLDAGGRVVAMASAARQLAGKLKTYASVETRPEFLKELLDAVDEFKRCCITPADLMGASAQTTGTLAQKLEELSLLMESYDALCAQGKRDPRDAMMWLLDQLEEGDYAENHTFYIDGFPDYTRQHLAILEHLISASPRVTVCLNCDEIGSPALAFEKAGSTARQIYAAAQRMGAKVKIEVLPEINDNLFPLRKGLFQGPITDTVEGLTALYTPSPWEAVMDAAQQIRRLVQSGCRYRDISVVCGDIAVYAPIADLIFARMNIPLYRSGTEDILQKSMLATVLSALDAAASDFEKKAMSRYLRSGLSPLCLEQGDELENYVITWGIRGGTWCKPWTAHPDGLSGEWDEASTEKLTRLNQQREFVIVPLNGLKKGLEDAKTVADQVKALYAFLEQITLEQRLSAMAEELDAQGENRQTQILNQLWEILISALEQLYDVLGDAHWETEHFCRLLRLLLSQYDVGTIPPVLDAVQLGPVTAMRCHACRHLIVLGVQEGQMPGYTGSSGVLTDQERTALRSLGVPLTGGAMEGIQSEFAEIYGVFCGSTQTVRIYRDAEPSFLFRRLSEMAGAEQALPPSLGFAPADIREAGLYLAGLHQEEAAQTLQIADAYIQAEALRDYRLGRLPADAVTGLYGTRLALSASQVDTQADCRMRYFLQYGLKARERREVTVDPTEFGTYVHDVLEHTAAVVMERGGFHKVSKEETLAVAKDCSDSYIAERFSQLDSSRMAYLLERNRRELDMVVEELWEELSQSEFAPVGFEVGFGEGEAMPPIAIPDAAMNAILRGFVDRVDLWQSPGSLYYRVVDYKTGKKDFDYCDVLNGIGLQMLLYLFALKHNGQALLGKNAVGAGIQYFPARAPYLPADHHTEPEEAEKNRQKEWKRKGLLLADEAVLTAMDASDDQSRLDISRKGGSLGGNVATREQLGLLEKYVFHILAKLVADIAGGEVTPNPYTRGSNHDACRFCPYGAVCRGSQEETRRSYKTVSSADFWKAVEEALNTHG